MGKGRFRFRFRSCLCPLDWDMKGPQAQLQEERSSVPDLVVVQLGGSPLWGMTLKKESRNCRGLRVPALCLRFRSSLVLKNRIKMGLKD